MKYLLTFLAGALTVFVVTYFVKDKVEPNTKAIELQREVTRLESKLDSVNSAFDTFLISYGNMKAANQKEYEIHQQEVRSLRAFIRSKPDVLSDPEIDSTLRAWYPN